MQSTGGIHDLDWALPRVDWFWDAVVVLETDAKVGCYGRRVQEALWERPRIP